MRMGILRIRDAMVLDVNEFWVRDMAFTREQIVGQSLFTQTAWLGEEIPRLRQLLEAGKPVRNIEGTSWTKSGEKRDALLSTEMIELGGEPCLLWVAADITDRKRSEEALRESEELFRTSFENATTGVCLVGTDGKFLSVNRTLCDMLGYSSSELEGMSFNDVTREEDKHIGATFVSKALDGEVSSAHLEKRYLHKDGHALWAQVSTALVRRPSGQSYFISHIQDITSRKQAEKERALLMHDLGKRIRELTAVHRTASLLLEERLSDEELLREMSAVLPPAWQYPDVCEARISYGRIVVQSARWRETAWAQSENLTTRNAVVGSITVAYLEERPAADDGPFLTEERDLLRSLADMLAAHFERKRAGEQIKATSEQLRALMTDLRSAREEEGIRIAREIHDELGSALTSLRWDLEEIERISDKDTDSSRQSALRSKIGTMFGLVESTIDAVRRISSELRPSILDDLGLISAVEWQGQQFQRRTGITVHYECMVDNLNVDAEQSTAVFRIFQETLTNVLRHAQASRIDVCIEDDASHFLLTVRDNGRGIQNAEKNSPSALGLLGMRERAHLIGGQIEIAGTTGRGTTVTLRVPLQKLSGAAASA
jgi:PAS domain S-box-containing protein